MASSVISKGKKSATELDSQDAAPSGLQKRGKAYVDECAAGNISLCTDQMTQREDRNHFVKYLLFDLLEDKLKDPTVLPQDWQGRREAKMKSIQEYLNLSMQDDPNGVKEWMALKNSSSGEPVWATPKRLEQALAIWDEAWREAKQTLPDNTRGDTRKVTWSETHREENQAPKTREDHRRSTQVAFVVPEGQSRDTILMKPAELTLVENSAVASPPCRRSDTVVQPLKEGPSPNQPIDRQSSDSTFSGGAPGCYKNPPVIMRPRQSYGPSSKTELLPSPAGLETINTSIEEILYRSDAESPLGNRCPGTGTNATHFQFDNPARASQSGGKVTTSKGALTLASNVNGISDISQLQSGSGPSKISGNKLSPGKDTGFAKALKRWSFGQHVKEQVAIQKAQSQQRIKQLDDLVTSTEEWSGPSLSSDVDEDMIRDILENIWSLKICEGLKFEMTANLIRVMQGFIHDLRMTKQELVDAMQDLTTINQDLLDEARKEYGEHFNLHLIRALEEQPYLPGSGLKRQTLKDNMIYSYAIKEELHPGWGNKPDAVMNSEGREGPGSHTFKQHSNDKSKHQSEERNRNSKSSKTIGQAPKSKKKVQKPNEVDIFALEKVANKIKGTLKRAKKMERRLLPQNMSANVPHGEDQHD